MNETRIVPVNDTIVFTFFTLLFVFILVLSCALELIFIILACYHYRPWNDRNSEVGELQEYQNSEIIPLGNREDIEVSQEE